MCRLIISLLHHILLDSVCVEEGEMSAWLDWHVLFPLTTCLKMSTSS